MISQIKIAVFIIFSAQTLLVCVSGVKNLNQHTMPQGKLIKYYGYPYENHTIVTEDGFFLTIGRIPYRESAECPKKKAVALALHGIFSNGNQFVYLGKNASLGLTLHDHCYDVWLINNRGTRYTNRHANFTTKSRQYWNATLDDWANDAGIIIQYILATTHETSLHAIGFSLGTTLLMIHYSKHPELQKEVRSLQLMAPIAFTDTVEAVARWIPKNLLYDISRGASDLLSAPTQGDDYLQHSITSELCLDPTSSGCNSFSGILSATNDSYTEPSAAKQQLLWSGYFPDRMPVKVCIHMAQSHMSGKFTMFDYGDANNDTYGRETPPDYHLEKIKIPTYLYHSTDDPFSTLDANQLLEKSLGNVRRRHFTENAKVHHTDYPASFNNVTQNIYASIIEAMDSHN